MKRKSRFAAKVLPALLALVMVMSAGASAIAGVIDGSITIGDQDTGYTPDSLAHGGYTLNGPITSGDRETYDDGLNDGTGGTTTTTDGVSIDKNATYDQTNGTGTITLTVDATKPTKFTYFPPPRMDYVLVVDLTTSMTAPLRGRTDESAWQMFWDDRTRIYQTREAIKEAADLIWDANPSSTITIVPFAEGVMVPNSTGGGFSYSGFTPSTSSFSTSNTSTDPTILSHVHIPTNPDFSNPANYSNLANNQALTSRYSYYKVTKDDGGDTFGDSIDALALASGTNTSAGVATANTILESGNLEATDQENRVVFVITDGGANIIPRDGSIPNWHYATVYYPEAARLTGEACAETKDPTKGNAVVSVISIAPAPIMISNTNDTYPNGTDSTYAYYTSYDRSGTIEWTAATADRPTPGAGQPYAQPTDCVEVVDTQNGPYGMCTNWATSPAHYYGSDDTESAVFNVIKNSVRESVTLFSSAQASLFDALNTNMFEMDMSVDPVVKVSIDGAPAIDETDPTFPSEISLTRTAEGITADLGTMPYGTSLAASSNSVVTITYSFKLKADPGAHFADLHTNIDDETYLKVTSPRHNEANSSEVVYSNDPFIMPFPTPVITLDDDQELPHLTLQKIDENGGFLAGATFAVSTSSSNGLEVSPADAAGEEFVIAPNATYTIKEMASPSGYEPLSGDIAITTNAAGVPSITANPDNAATLAVTSTAGDPVRATLVVQNTPGGGGEGNVFRKVPSVTNVSPGQNVDYTISGFGNAAGKAVTSYAITDLPPEGLNFVSGSLPAFTKGAGLTYSVLFRTNQRSSVTLQSGLAADVPQAIDTPVLALGEYLTGLVIAFDQVPSGFGMGDTIRLTFQVGPNPPSETLTNRAMLSYEVDGGEVIIDDPGVPIDTGSGSGAGSGSGSGSGGGTSSSANSRTGDAGIFLPVALCVLAIGACLIFRRKKGTAF